MKLEKIKANLTFTKTMICKKIFFLLKIKIIILYVFGPFLTIFFHPICRSAYKRVYRFLEQAHWHISNNRWMCGAGWLWGFTRSSTIGAITFTATFHWYSGYTTNARLFCSMHRKQRYVPYSWHFHWRNIFEIWNQFFWENLKTIFFTNVLKFSTQLFHWKNLFFVDFLLKLIFCSFFFLNQN